MGTLLGVLGELRRRLSFTRARHDQWASELDEEMAFHVEMRRQQNLERGMSSDEARRAAAIDFGNTMVLRERSREAWLVPGMEGFLQDVRVALRNLVKNPGWTGLAAGTLAIAIAVCAGVFSLVHAVLVRPLPYASERELVLLFEDRTSEGFPQSDTSPGNYRQLKVDSKSYQGMSLFHRTDATLSADGTAERITGVNVTPDFFDVLGIKPSMGRFFGADNAGARVVVISHELWQRNLGGRADIIGHNLQLGEESWTVVGVAPRRFQFLFPDAQFWRPLQFSLETWHRRELRYLNVVARLRSGTPIEQAQAELTALAPSFHAASPTANRNFRAVAVPLRQFLTGGVRHRVLLLAAFAGLILLISSANVAHLMLSRSVRRASELAIRLSLGATRRRLLRQLVTESLVLSSAAGVAGFVLALWAVRVLAFLVPDSMAMFVIMESAWATLSITAFLVVFTGLVCGLLPALRISSVNWNQAIRAGSPRVVGGFGQERLRGLLVVSEVALAVVLAVGASLLLRSLYEVLNVDPGFRAERILTAETSPGRTFWPLRERTAYIEEALRRIRSLPGVEAAAFMSAAPFTWKGGRLNFQIEGMQAQPEQGALNRQVTPDYFAALRIPVINGRAFTSQDRIGAAPVAVINERLAKLWFDGRNPIGHQVRIAGPKFADAGMRIVGVVGNVREMGLLRDPPPIIYVPHAQTEADFNVPFTLAVRTAGDPSQLVPALRSELAAGWAGMPVSRIRTLAQITEAEMADRRPVALLGTSLALLAVVLACVGVYGLLAFSISQRVPEIGIRMALGASRFVIASTIMRGAALLVGCGVLAGTIASAALTQTTVRTVLYNIKPHDPMTFVAVPLVMLALAVLACLMPVRTALAVDPAIALRKD